MRIALLGNGLSYNAALQLAKYDLVIAIDGAANSCAQYDITPNIIIGDMDSIQVDPTVLYPQAKIVTMQDQSQTDLDKALAYIDEHIAPDNKVNNDITIDGFWLTSSNRLDHTLNVVTQVMNNPRLEWIYSEHERMCALPETIELMDPVGTRLSLLSLIVSPTSKFQTVATTLVVSITGCEWSGQSMTIDQKNSGVSNTIIKSPAYIHKISGHGLLILANKS